MWLQQRRTMGGVRARCTRHITLCRSPLDTTAPQPTLTLPFTLSPLTLTHMGTQVLMRLGTSIRAKGLGRRDFFKPSLYDVTR